MGVEREVQREREPTAAGSSPAVVTRPAAARKLLALQRTTGNRGVRHLMRRPIAENRVSIGIIVEQPMTPHEFAVRAFMQAFRMPGDLAEQRVSAIEARGFHGTGPNFANGVHPDEVGKRLTLNYPLPTQSETEQADVKGRAEQLAVFGAGAVGDRRGNRPALLAANRQGQGHEAPRQGMADASTVRSGCGLATRSCATATGSPRCRPARARCCCPRTSPSRRSNTRRCSSADKLEQFSEEDWALYQRRINASTADYAAFEASVDRFRARQQAEGALNSRIHGMTPSTRPTVPRATRRNRSRGSVAGSPRHRFPATTRAPTRLRTTTRRR